MRSTGIAAGIAAMLTIMWLSCGCPACLGLLAGKRRPANLLEERESVAVLLFGIW